MKTLGGGKWSALAPAALLPDKQPSCALCVGGWVAPKAGLDVQRKKEFLVSTGNSTA